MIKANVVFIGCSRFGLRCLKSLANMEEINVSGVVTAPQKFSISYIKESHFNNVLYIPAA